MSFSALDRNYIKLFEVNLDFYFLFFIVKKRLTLSVPERHFCRLRVDCQSDIFVVWGLTARRHICRLIDFFLAVHGFRHNQ